MNTNEKKYEGNRDNVVKSIIPTEQIDDAYAVINTFGDLLETCTKGDAFSETLRVLSKDLDDYSMMQYVSFHNIIKELCPLVGALRDLLKMSKSDMDSLAKKTDTPLDVMVLKMMLKSILED